MPQTRVLLEGDTLHIGFYREGKAPYPEDVVAAALLRAVAQHLKVDLRTQGIFWGDYCYFAGITGEAFRFLELMGLSQRDPAAKLVEQYGQLTAARMYQIALESAGLTGRVCLGPDLPEPTALRRQIVESLRERQTPVIAYSKVFTPPEPFLITGYDNGGEILLGWSHFQNEVKGNPAVSFEPGGQIRLQDGTASLYGAIFITGRQPPPAPREVFRAAVERAVRELRATQGGGGPLGTAGMELWSAHLEDDKAFTGLTPEALAKAQSDHFSTAGDLAERRALAGSFVELASRDLPEVAPDLLRARTAFQGAHDTVYEIWETVAKTNPFDPDLAKFADPARRRTIAGLVRRLMQFDQRGAACLERASRGLAGQEPGPVVQPDPLLDGTAILSKAAAAPPARPFTWAPENIALPNLLGMLRAFLGESWGDLNEAEQAHGKLDYVLWTGFSGAAFEMLSNTPEKANLPLVFDALGYDYELWLSGQLAKETGLPCRVWGWDDNLRRRILWNLRDRRLPVLLLNCGSWPDWYLVTRIEDYWVISGYGGSSGEGYRPNEPLDDQRNPLRHIELFDWMKGRQTWTIQLTARRTTPRPPLTELYRRAIAWGAASLPRQTMKVLGADGREFLSANPYEDWAAMLAEDELFPANQPDVLKQRRQMLLGPEVELAERRFYGADFLDLAARRLERPELAEAAGHFRAIHQLMQQLWAKLGGMEAPEAHLKLADRTTREAIAQYLLQMATEDAAAAPLLAR